MTIAEETQLPWHVAPVCPKCWGPFGKPVGLSNPIAMRCCACGHDWLEANAEQVARAWFGYGANEARVYLEREAERAGVATAGKLENARSLILRWRAECDRILCADECANELEQELGPR